MRINDDTVLVDAPIYASTSHHRSLPQPPHASGSAAPPPMPQFVNPPRNQHLPFPDLSSPRRHSRRSRTPDLMEDTEGQFMGQLTSSDEDEYSSSSESQHRSPRMKSAVPLFGSSNRTVLDMPLRGSRDAPKTFRGHHSEVEYFIAHYDRLLVKFHVTDPEDQCRLILDYCATDVQGFIRASKYYQQNKWSKLRNEILQCYDADKAISRYKPSDIATYTLRTKSRPFQNLSQWKKYYIKYKTMAGILLQQGHITQVNYDVYFWLGIEQDLRRTLEQRINQLNPARNVHRQYSVREINIAAEWFFRRNRAEAMVVNTADYGVDLDSGTSDAETEDESDLDSDDSDYENYRRKHRAKARAKKEKEKKKKKKTANAQATGKSRIIPTSGTVEEVTSLIRQLNKMTITDPEYAPVYYRVLTLDTTGVAVKCVQPPRISQPWQERPSQKGNQANASTTGTTGSSSGAPGPTTYPNNIPLPNGCYGCGTEGHRIGDCPEILELKAKNVIKVDESTRRIRMGDGTFIKRTAGESLAAAARRQAAPRVMFTSAHQYTASDSDESSAAFIEEYHATVDTSDIESEVSEYREDMELDAYWYVADSAPEVRDCQKTPGEVYLTVPGPIEESEQDEACVNAAERTLPSTRAARRDIFDGVMLPRRDRAKNDPEPAKAPTAPKELTRNKKEQAPRQVKDLLPELTPVDARVPRDDIDMPDLEVSAKRGNPSPPSDKGPTTENNDPQKAKHLMENPSKHTGRYSDLQAGVQIPSIIDRILDLTVPLTLNVVRADIAALRIQRPVDMTMVTNMNDANGGKGQLRGYIRDAEFGCGGSVVSPQTVYTRREQRANGQEVHHAILLNARLLVHNTDTGEPEVPYVAADSVKKNLNRYSASIHREVERVYLPPPVTPFPCAMSIPHRSPAPLAKLLPARLPLRRSGADTPPEHFRYLTYPADTPPRARPVNSLTTNLIEVDTGNRVLALPTNAHPRLDASPRPGTPGLPRRLHEGRPGLRRAHSSDDAMEDILPAPPAPPGQPATLETAQSAARVPPAQKPTQEEIGRFNAEALKRAIERKVGVEGGIPAEHLVDRQKELAAAVESDGESLGSTDTWSISSDDEMSGVSSKENTAVSAVNNGLDDEDRGGESQEREAGPESRDERSRAGKRQPFGTANRAPRSGPNDDASSRVRHHPTLPASSIPPPPTASFSPPPAPSFSPPPAPRLRCIPLPSVFTAETDVGDYFSTNHRRDDDDPRSPTSDCRSMLLTPDRPLYTTEPLATSSSSLLSSLSSSLPSLISFHSGPNAFHFVRQDDAPPKPATTTKVVSDRSDLVLSQRSPAGHAIANEDELDFNIDCVFTGIPSAVFEPNEMTLDLPHMRRIIAHHDATLARRRQDENSKVKAVIDRAELAADHCAPYLDFDAMDRNQFVVIDTYQHVPRTRKTLQEVQERADHEEVMKKFLEAISVDCGDGTHRVRDELGVPVSETGDRARALSVAAMLNGAMYRLAIRLFAQPRLDEIGRIAALRARVLYITYEGAELVDVRRLTYNETLLHQPAPFPPPYLHGIEYMHLRLLMYIFAREGDLEISDGIANLLKYRFREPAVITHFLCAGLLDPNDTVVCEGVRIPVEHRSTPLPRADCDLRPSFHRANMFAQVATDTWRAQKLAGDLSV
ncbi:hypothetical protein DFH06DRAFT_1343921 [Mycena polygramma]|nr:hypothetical protein DFH06DRAFT_1343921 [Mycena polygramma]